MFYISILEQNIIKKRQINKFLILEFKADNDKKYELETIYNSAVYTKKVDKYLPRLYYLVK